MNKEKYLDELRKNLNGLPLDDIDEAVSDIEEYFDNGIGKGRTEEDISSALGKAKVLALTIKAEYDISTITSKHTTSNIFRTFSIFIGLGFVNIILLPLFLSVMLVAFSMYLVSGGFFLSGVVCIFAPILKFFLPTIVSTGAIPVLAMPLVGALILVISIKFHKAVNITTKLLFKFLLNYFNSNKKIIRE